MISVSVIIVNYHTEELVIDCIKSIFEKTIGVDYEIIVVDNDPTRGLGETLYKEFDDRLEGIIKYIPQKEMPASGLPITKDLPLQGENICFV